MLHDPLRRFFALAFGVSWTVAGIAALTGGMAHPAGRVGLGFLYMLGPAIAALIVTWGQPWPARRMNLGLGLKVDRWMFVAWLVPITALVLSTLGSALVPGTHLVAPVDGLVTRVTAFAGPEEAAKLAALPPTLLSIGLVGQALILGALINLPLMLSEELGWRGYLWSRWSALGFWPNALATGAVWGIWHAPIILLGHNYPDAPVLGVALMTLFCVLLAPLIHLVRERGGTVFHACLFHATINAGATLGDLCISTDSWHGKGIIGLPGFVVLLAMVGVVGVRSRAAAG